ncbi:hypothetical protein GW17_00055608 [Ensete ventricosum]|nr:hypothetical protein GW17_00055608 [Ensete ventricosum]
MGVTITIRSGVWSREAEEEMERHGMGLLALSHAYRMRWLKRRCEAGVAARLSAVKVMDVLKLARLCDAPRLYQRCMRLVAKDSEAVRQSEGWRFVQKHDPGLEMEVLQFLQETSQVCDLTVVMDACVILRAKGFSSSSATSLPAAGSCLRRAARTASECGSSSAFTPPSAISLTPAGFLSAIVYPVSCYHHRQFKKKVQEEKVDRTWRLLVKKVATARVMSSLANRKVPEIVQKSRMRYRGTR